MSARSDLLTNMVNQWSNRTEYLVHRGPLNWATFDFDSHPQAVSIMQEQGNFGELFGKFDQGTFAWEVFAKTGMSAIDDNVTDHMIADAKGVIRELHTLVNASQDAVMLKADSFTWSEVSDTTMQVQGVIIQFDVTY